MDYASFISEVARLAKVDPAGADYLANIPFAIEYAEGRIYRELDMILARSRNSTGSTTANTRDFSIPAGFLVVERMNAITPAGTTTPNSGTRRPLSPVSLDWLDAVYGAATGAALGVPQVFTVFTETQAMLGPIPDDVYTIEVIGVIQPPPMSVSNTQPSLVQLLPDLYLAAAMIQVSGWQKNYGQQADDPGMAMSWEGQYGLLFASANTTEMRKKFESQGWTPKSPTPLAKPRN